jgi:hypothetical protein
MATKCSPVCDPKCLQAAERRPGRPDEIVVELRLGQGTECPRLAAQDEEGWRLSKAT